MDTAVIILTGGRSSRLGGRHKPAVSIVGRPVISTLVSAARQIGAASICLCGPAEGLDASERQAVTVVAEEPPFGGPLNGIACAVAHLEAVSERNIVLIAGDMPFMTSELLNRLLAAVQPGIPAAAEQSDGRIQFLCAAWRESDLRAALSALETTRDLPVKAIYRDRAVTAVACDPAELLDIDTPADLLSAESIAAQRAVRPAGDGETPDPAGPQPQT